jgi:hypothetical protein
MGMIDYLKNYINTGSFTPKKAASIGGVKNDGLFSISHPKNLDTQGFTVSSEKFNLPQKLPGTLQMPAPDVRALKAKVPLGSSYVSQAAKPATAPPTSPRTTGTSASVMRSPQPQGWQEAYTSTDPSVQQKMADMSRQAEGTQNIQPPTPYQAPTPAQTSGTPTSALGQAYLDAIRAQGQASPIEAQLAELQRQAGDVRVSEEAGINKNLANPEIPMDVITGRQTNIERSAQGRLNALSNQQTPLVTQLAMEQARRTAQTNSAKAAYDMSLEQQKLQQEASKPISISAGTTLLDPSTGQPIYQAPFADKSDSTSIQEYEYAKQNGYTGSFTDYKQMSGSGADAGLAYAIMQNPSVWDSLTPSIKSSLIPQLSQLGFSFPASLTATQKDDITTMQTVKDLASQLIGLGDKLPGVGAFGAGSLATFGTKFGIGSPEGQQVRDLLGNIQGTIAKLRGGTSFTPNEQKLLETYSPTINDADWQIIQKLKDLMAFIDSKRQNLLATSTMSATGGSAGQGGSMQAGSEWSW